MKTQKHVFAIVTYIQDPIQQENKSIQKFYWNLRLENKKKFLKIYIQVILCIIKMLSFTHERHSLTWGAFCLNMTEAVPPTSNH